MKRPKTNALTYLIAGS